MTAKQYLSQLRTLERRIAWLRDDIATIRAEAEGAKSVDYGRIRVQTSPDPDPLATYIDRLAKQERRLLDLYNQRIEIAIKINMQLADLTPALYADILYLRYVKGASLAEVADILNYSYSRIRHLHGVALQHFADKYL